MATVNLGRVKPIQRGAYSAGLSYAPLDFVTYNGQVFVCKQASSGNLPTNGTYFDPVVDIQSWWAAMQPNMVEKSDIGTAPNGIPLNQHLGGMAFQNPESVVIRPAASATPQQVGAMVFQLTNDTTLLVKVKGSDGTVRSATLTLA